MPRWLQNITAISLRSCMSSFNKNVYAVIYLVDTTVEAIVFGWDNNLIQYFILENKQKDPHSINKNYCPS